MGTTNPDRICVGVADRRPEKAKKRDIGALIDELRISDDVLWRADKVGQKVFTPPTEPYKVRK